uniref:C-type lectin domain-containing protein n=1 Tax=Monopterus albus TaxID=43700 RepID=A0A3Q3R3R5_MONAL
MIPNTLQKTTQGFLKKEKSENYCCLRPANYVFYTGRQRRPWQDAQSFCGEYHTDLLTIKSEEENQNLAGTKGWIGLYRQNSAGPWKWSRGDEIATFTSF